MLKIKETTIGVYASGCLLILLLLSHSTLTSAQEVEDEREFDYDEGSGIGPQHWGDLKGEWATCKNGDLQSPIDLSDQSVHVNPKIEGIKRNYKPSNATVKNRGHDIAVNWLGDAGSFQINGNNYDLKQSHWHSPSEHTINGKRYDLELHMVHLSSDSNLENRIVVVGVFYETGEPDEFISKLKANIAAMTGKKDERITGVIDPKEIKMGGNEYYSYVGSLTVPPCTEGVIWIIGEQVMSVSQEQVSLMRVAVHDYAKMNARPIQQRNRRQNVAEMNARPIQQRNRRQNLPLRNSQV